jgi:hypothetical protein
MLRTIQQDTTIILDLMEIDLESLPIKLRNNRFITRSKVRKVFHPNEDIGKSLNEK